MGCCTYQVRIKGLSMPRWRNCRKSAVKDGRCAQHQKTHHEKLRDQMPKEMRDRIEARNNLSRAMYLNKYRNKGK